MKSYGWMIKVIVLLLCLGGVFYLMKVLKTDGVNKEAFFLDEAAKQTQQGDVPSNKTPVKMPEFDLCQTRVKSVQFKWNETVYDIQVTGRNWRANGKDLAPVEMEKWLVLLCRVKAERMIDLATSTQKYQFKDFIKFNYVNDTQLQFDIEAPAFKFAESAFYSKPFLEMINNLKTMISASRTNSN